MNALELKVLVIDDDKEGQIDGFIAKARKNRIAIDHVRNYEDGLKKLEQQFYDYQGVILDARCFPDKHSEKNNLTDDNYIDANIQKVRSLTEKFKFIPHCIFTGYGGTFKKRLEIAGFKVFSKGLENDDVLNFIREGNKSETIYMNQHPEIMSLFQNKYLNSSYLSEIVRCLERIDNNAHSFEDIKNSAASVRYVMEGFYDSLAILKILPKSFKTNTERNRYLVGNLDDTSGRFIDEKFRAPTHIGWGLTMIHDASSKYLHHDRTIKTKEQSIYLQQAMVYSLFEVLLWLHRDIMEKHF